MPLCACDQNATGSRDNFMTHAPMSFCMGGFRPRTVMTVDPVSWRSKTMISDGPFLFRRSTSACGELPSLALNSRAKSARYVSHRESPFIMPRGGHNMSVARFYDWTEDPGDCYSVSRLYREIANIPQSQTNGLTNNHKGKININLSIAPSSGTCSSVPLTNVPTRTSFNSPGRMFVRDKKALTRGEREIIEGIYKNRSDLNAKDAIANLGFHVKSHQEAWQTGKFLIRNDRVDIKPLVKSTGQQQQQQQVQHQHQVCNCSDKTNSNNHSGNEDHNNTPSSVRSVPPESSGLINSSIPLSGRLGNKFASSRKLMETSPFPNCSQCQLEQRGIISQDLAKRAYLAHQKNQENNWDSRPCAPPSTPDKCVSKANDSDRFSSEQQPSFKQNKYSDHPHKSEVNGIYVSDVDSSSSSISSNRPSSGERNTSPRREGNLTSRSMSKIQKTINIIHSVLEENSAKLAACGKQNSESSGFYSNGGFQDVENLSELSGRKSFDSSEGSDSDPKKVKVKVYLPVAVNDENDELVSESGGYR